MLTLKPITKDNWEVAIELKVKEEQKPFFGFKPVFNC